ncbi:MAG: hypothetical protein O2894_11410, partial [Planctomycetota bacterium]|nr:hypothetical protein [Planctomycetota bacterium]
MHRLASALLAALVALTLWVAPARADEATEARIDRLERLLEAQSKQLEVLRQELSATREAARAEAPPVEPI